MTNIFDTLNYLFANFGKRKGQKGVVDGRMVLGLGRLGC